MVDIDNQEIQLVIITTFVLFNSFSKHRNSINYLVYDSLCNISKHSKGIKIIIYIDNKDRFNSYYSNNVDIINIKKKNKYNTPYFGFLINESIEKYKSNYYMFINGDIIITPNISDVVVKLNNLTREKMLNKDILCVATRSTLCYTTNNLYASKYHSDLYFKGAKSRTCSQDAFLMSKNVYNLNNNVYNNLLVGRAGIDNIILGCGLKNKNVEVIDLTNSLIAIHYKDCTINRRTYLNVCILFIFLVN